MNASAPEISVCIPVHNAGRHLSEAVASVLAQDADAEILVQDDASTDGAVDQLARLREPRVHICRERRRLGAATTRTHLIDRARGRYVAFLDADDVLIEGSLARRRRALEDHPSAVLVHGWFELVDQDGRRLPDWPPPFEAAQVLSPGAALHELLVSNFVTTSTSMARREALLRVGCFRASIGPSSTDWDMWLRLAETGDVVYLPERLARYRQHDATISASTRQTGARLRSDIRVVRAALSRGRRRAQAALVAKALVQAGDQASRGDRAGATTAVIAGLRAAPWLAADRDAWGLLASLALGRGYQAHRRSKRLMRRCADHLTGTRIEERIRRQGAHDPSYEAELLRSAELVRSVVPPDGHVAAIDKWDPTLLWLAGRRGRHFPDRRLMANGYPADSDAAVAHLEAVRADGADHLVVPPASSWWLEHYRGLRSHLERRYRLAAQAEGCAIWDLSGVVV